jgi:hypothetical protein
MRFGCGGAYGAVNCQVKLLKSYQTLVARTNRFGVREFLDYVLAGISSLHGGCPNPLALTRF